MRQPMDARTVVLIQRPQLLGPTDHRNSELAGGTITSEGEGALIHLIVCPVMAIFGLFALCASGVVAGGLFAVLDHVIVFPLGLVVGFSLSGVVVYAVGRWNAVNRLNEILGNLEDLLSARRRI